MSINKEPETNGYDLPDNFLSEGQVSRLRLIRSIIRLFKPDLPFIKVTTGFIDGHCDVRTYEVSV